MALDLEWVARSALEGVGDARLGEWVQCGAKALHLRRRLSEFEAILVGQPRDIRGTAEERRRLKKLKRELPTRVRRAVFG